MDKERALALLLLDLCAFGCSLADDESSRREFEAACRAVEEDFPFDAHVYRAHVASAIRKHEGETGTRRRLRAKPDYAEIEGDTRA